MKQSHEPEECTCAMCRRERLINMIAGFGNENNMNLFEVVGMLDSVRFSMLHSMQMTVAGMDKPEIPNN